MKDDATLKRPEFVLHAIRLRRDTFEEIKALAERAGMRPSDWIGSALNQHLLDRKLYGFAKEWNAYKANPQKKRPTPLKLVKKPKKKR